MNTRTLQLLLMLIVAGAVPVLAQEEARAHRSVLRGAVMMGNSHVPNAWNGDKQVSIIPVWGVDVDYFFHRRWSVALQGDIKLQSFEIDNGEAVLERVNPVAVVAVMHYHALRHWSFFTGPGYEIERHENFFLVKVGTEYSFEITENFEIALNLNYENKDEVYDAWTFGVAFNKKLWQRAGQSDDK